jgi:hypothetical protein
MSRSNPSQNDPNPATRFFEWQGEQGVVRHYDKDAKQNVVHPLPFTFLLLDELASVRGWHNASNSGIYSNEVRDTRTDIMVVKAFKGGTLAEGLYKDIKDRINTQGGQFHANCYLAYRAEPVGMLSIGSLKFKGAALRAWMEFRKAHRGDLYKRATNITGYDEGKNGRIIFRVPTFELKDVSPATDAAAVELDAILQQWLTGYLGRRTSDKAEPHNDVIDATDDVVYDDTPVDAPDDSEIPF